FAGVLSGKRATNQNAIRAEPTPSDKRKLWKVMEKVTGLHSLKRAPEPDGYARLVPCSPSGRTPNPSLPRKGDLRRTSASPAVGPPKRPARTRPVGVVPGRAH